MFCKHEGFIVIVKVFELYKFNHLVKRLCDTLREFKSHSIMITYSLPGQCDILLNNQDGFELIKCMAFEYGLSIIRVDVSTSVVEFNSELTVHETAVNTEIFQDSVLTHLIMVVLFCVIK